MLSSRIVEIAFFRSLLPGAQKILEILSLDGQDPLICVQIRTTTHLICMGIIPNTIIVLQTTTVNETEGVNKVVL
jgi:hypothetical protein